MLKKVIVLALMFLFLAVASAFAMDPFTEAMQKAYAPYRASLFKTNTKVKTESQEAVKKAQEAWDGIIKKFAANAPAPYDRDADFSATLSQVSKIYVQAAEEISNDKLSKAHETLENVRDLLADLRKRNNVIVYSDYVNEYHAVMEELDLKGKETLAGENGAKKIIAKTGVLEYLYNKMVTEAPVEYKTNEEYLGLMKSIESSISALRKALFEQDSKAVIESLGKLKAPYSRLFLKFG